jgi:hypothetical protein
VAKYSENYELLSLILPFCDVERQWDFFHVCQVPETWKASQPSILNQERRLPTLLQLHIISATWCFSTAARPFRGRIHGPRHHTSVTPRARCSYPPSTQVSPGILFILQGTAFGVTVYLNINLATVTMPPPSCWILLLILLSRKYAKLDVL